MVSCTSHSPSDKMMDLLVQYIEILKSTHINNQKDVDELKEKIEILETKKEKLTLSAKCKKYSIKVENIYGDFCRNLYSNAEMQKDNKVIYKFRTDFVPASEEEKIYMFVTGKKRYDTELYSTIVAYRDLEL